MSEFFYYTGVTVWFGITIATVLIIIYSIWIYSSITISYWWVRLEAVDLNPRSDTIKRDFMENRFWKVRVFWLIAKDFKWVIQTYGSTLHGDCWRADYTKLVPQVKAWRYK